MVATLKTPLASETQPRVDVKLFLEPCFTVNIDIEGYLGMYNTGGGHVTCTRNHKAE